MNIAVIFAGGVGKRMRSDSVPKQFLEIQDKPIIIHTLEHFQNAPEVDAIVIACVADWISHLENLISRYQITKVRKIVRGGETGQLSIYHGLLAAKEISEGEDSIVLIHDGVRPLIDQQIISDNIASVKQYGSAITSSAVNETILLVKGNDDTAIDFVTDRSHTKSAKAPQSFWLKDILACHEEAMRIGKHDFIDSCTMMQHYGHPLHLIEGPAENIKITTIDDLYMMKAILEVRKISEKAELE